MRSRWCVLAALLAAPLAAQQPAEPQDTAEAAQLRQQIESRFHEIVRQRLALTDDQDGRLRATQEKYRQQRQPLFLRRQAIDEALGGQMRPGVAANSDSVRRLMDERQQIPERLAQIDRDEDREMSGYLSPVQRAQFQMIRGRFVQRLNELRRERQGQGMMGPRPRAGGGMRPRAGQRPPIRRPRP